MNLLKDIYHRLCFIPAAGRQNLKRGYKHANHIHIIGCLINLTSFDDAVGNIQKYYGENCKDTTLLITFAVKGPNLNSILNSLSCFKHRHV